ncbi:MAG: MOSC domain-containing protein [Pseudomonadota bacterium]
MTDVTISGLWTYPIKSMAGISLRQSKLLAKGLEYDRSWMLVDNDLNFITQRQHPKMALISVSIEDYGLRVYYKNMPALIIPWVDTELESFQSLSVKIWKDECSALHINSAIDNWFGEVLGIDCRLVYIPDVSDRYVDRDYALNNEQTRFADGFPLLLISEASLNNLNSRLSASKKQPVNMQHFRPNIVVKGCAAFAEDQWKNFSINGTVFSAVKACSRCIITTVDPSTGERSTDKEPLQTLLQYRKKENQVFFGQNVLFNYKTSQNLSLGDSLLF